MKPEIHNPKESGKQGLKPVRLALIYDDEDPCLVAIDDKGETVAYLIVFREHSAKTCAGAEENLEGIGYDTSWCRWDDHGKMVLE